MGDIAISIENLKIDRISAKTLETYKTRLRSIIRSCEGRSLGWILQHPSDVIKLVKQNMSSNNGTIAACAVAICKLYSVYPELQTKWPKAYQLWQHSLVHYRKQDELEIQKSKMTNKQKDKIVDWDSVHTKFCELQRSSDTRNKLQNHMEYLLFAMLLNTKPKRADLGKVQIVEKKQEIDEPNYILIPRRNKTGTLVLNDYKTSKVYGTLIEPLSENLVSIINDSVNQFPREYLIISSRTHEPYDKKNSYSHFVRRTFYKYFGKAMGISLWRNVYVRANIDFNEMPYNEMAESARLSGHSVNQMFKTYRKVDMPQRPRDKMGKPVTCN